MLTLNNLLSNLPELVLNRHVFILSCDSGSFQPTEDEKQKGWKFVDGVAISPKVRHTNELPVCGWDEWYIAEDLSATPKDFDSFVNYAGFSLRDPISSHENQHHETNFHSKEYDQYSPEQHVLQQQNLFWQQLHSTKCESYILDGDSLICITCNDTYFEKLKAFFETNE